MMKKQMKGRKNINNLAKLKVKKDSSVSLVIRLPQSSIRLQRQTQSKLTARNES
jgi:hypothetical protein